MLNNVWPTTKSFLLGRIGKPIPTVQVDSLQTKKSVVQENGNEPTN